MSEIDEWVELVKRANSVDFFTHIQFILASYSLMLTLLAPICADCGGSGASTHTHQKQLFTLKFIIISIELCQQGPTIFFFSRTNVCVVMNAKALLRVPSIQVWSEHWAVVVVVVTKKWNTYNVHEKYDYFSDFCELFSSILSHVFCVQYNIEWMRRMCLCLYYFGFGEIG